MLIGGALLSLSATGYVIIWDVATGAARELASFDSRIGWLAIHPDGQLVGVPLGDGTARLVDLVTSPVLVTRHSFPYRKIMLVLAELPFHPAAAQVAIDLSRREVLYEMSLSVAGRLMQVSLLDFIR